MNTVDHLEDLQAQIDELKQQIKSLSERAATNDPLKLSDISQESTIQAPTRRAVITALIALENKIRDQLQTPKGE